ncbi:MAG: hypothetical protein Q8P35_01635 [Candidatus Yanofskybacteria bacterium]|nr:hypothetical protein [Candidatus Yanofskybacteria bacterium]
MTRLVRVVALIVGVLLVILLKLPAGRYLYALCLMVVATAVYLIVECSSRRKSMETLALENASKEYEVRAWIRYFEAKEVKRGFRNNLDELKRNNPQRVWESLEILLSNLPNQIVTVQAHLTAAKASMDRGWKYAPNASRHLNAAEVHLKRVCELPNLIAAKQREIHHAASIFPDLRLEVSERITKLRRLVMYPQVSEDIRERLAEAEEQQQENLLKIRPNLTDWVEAVNDLKATKNVLAAIHHDMDTGLNRSA